MSQRPGFLVKRHRPANVSSTNDREITVEIRVFAPIHTKRIRIQAVVADAYDEALKTISEKWEEPSE